MTKPIQETLVGTIIPVKAIFLNSKLGIVWIEVGMDMLTRLLVPDHHNITSLF